MAVVPAGLYFVVLHIRKKNSDLLRYVLSIHKKILEKF